MDALACISTAPTLTSNTAHHSVACRTTFKGNNVKLIFFCVTLSFSRYGGIWAHDSLQHSFSSLRFAGMCLSTTFQSGGGLDFNWTTATP